MDIVAADCQSIVLHWLMSCDLVRGLGRLLTFLVSFATKEADLLPSHSSSQTPPGHTKAGTYVSCCLWCRQSRWSHEVVWAWKLQAHLCRQEKDSGCRWEGASTTTRSFLHSMRSELHRCRYKEMRHVSVLTRGRTLHAQMMGLHSQRTSAHADAHAFNRTETPGWRLESVSFVHTRRPRRSNILPTF